MKPLESNNTRKLCFSVGQNSSLKDIKLTQKGVSVEIGADNKKLKEKRIVQPVLTLPLVQKNAKGTVIHKSQS